MVWETIHDNRDTGHAIFKDRVTGNYAVADGSGHYPEDTDDGVLWITHIRFSSNAARYILKVVDDNGRRSNVYTDVLTYHAVCREIGHNPTKHHDTTIQFRYREPMRLIASGGDADIHREGDSLIYSAHNVRAEIKAIRQDKDSFCPYTVNIVGKDISCYITAKMLYALEEELVFDSSIEGDILWERN